MQFGAHPASNAPKIHAARDQSVNGKSVRKSTQHIDFIGFIFWTPPFRLPLSRGRDMQAAFTPPPGAARIPLEPRMIPCFHAP